MSHERKAAARTEVGPVEAVAVGPLQTVAPSFPVIPLKKGRIDPGSPILRGSEEWKRRYRSRSAVEREFGRLKNFYGLVLRTRGLKKAQLHADLVILARLAQALDRALV